MTKVKLTSFLLIMAMLAPLAGCGKTEAYRQAQIILSTLRAAVPIVRAISPAIAGKLELMLPVAQKLKDALANNDNTNAVLFLQELLPTFNDIIEHDVLSLDQGIRDKVLIALALVDIGLNFLAEFYEQNAPPAMKDMAVQKGGNVISAFARKPVWGHKYAKGK